MTAVDVFEGQRRRLFAVAYRMLGSVAEAEEVVQEAWIRRWPSEYGIWMLHARQRNNIDDHPLFVDHAVDERYRRWM